VSSDTQENLRQSDQPYRLLFDANPQPMWVFDRASKRMLAVNTAALVRYGYSREAFLQLSILDIRRTLQGQRVTEAQIDEDPIGPNGLRLTARWKHALEDGSLIDVEITSSDLIWDGQSARLVVVNEVTEQIASQRQTEQAQRETSNVREMLNLVVNRVSDAIFALDKALRFTYLNAPALRLLRRERADQLIGRYVWDEYDVENALVVHDAYARVLQSQQAEVFESSYAPWDKWYEIRMFPSPEGLSIFCSDITERKLSEHLLVRQEREFRVLAEQMPALIYRSSLEPPFQATYVSPYLLTLGYTASEWLSDPQAWANALHPDDRERVMRELSVAYAQGAEHETEYRLRDAQGQWRHFCGRSRRIEPSDGSPAYLQGIALDLTDLVESEQALRASEASLRRSELRYRLAAASGQVWDWDLVPDQLNLSADFWQQLGFLPVKAAQALARLSALIHPEDLLRHREAMRCHLKDRAPFGVEVRIGDARGEWRWMHTQGQAQWDNTGRAIFMAGTTVDITPRKKAEAALRESEAYRRSLFEQLADGVLLIDDNHQIVDANPQAMDMVGYPGEQLFGMSLHGLQADQSAQHPADTLLADHSPHSGPLVEWNIVRRDGTRLLVEVSTRALDATRYIAVLRDITDRRAAETTLVTYQIELSELTQRLLMQEKNTTQRVAQALHDNLGQSLAVARLHLDALLITAGDTLPPALAEQCQHLTGVLAQAVLDVRDVMADLRPPLLEEQGLAAALDNETRMTPQAVSTDVLLEVADGLSRQRWPADVEYSTFMVVREAIANARLHAHASLIRVLLGGDEHRLAVDVIDDGAGISADMKQGRPGHLGIVGMRERAISIGARFAIQAEPGGGTRVCLHWQEPGS
jgi:PAS domain S-box-containing protein